MPSHPSEAATYPTLRRRAASAFAATAAASAIAGVVLTYVGFSPWAGIKSISLIAALAVVSLPYLPEHGRAHIGPANTITLFRAVGIATLAALLGEALPPTAGVPIAAAGAAAFVLDGIDGRVARKTGWASPFGARLDMELDALTVLVLCFLSWQLDRVGPWILWCGALRYLFVGASWQWPWMNAPLPADPRRAIVCGLQIGSVLLCLLPWPAPLSTVVGAAGTLALTLSFAIDTVWLYRNRASHPE